MENFTQIQQGASRGRIGRGVSSGGGQSSLGYLFGSNGESPKPAAPVSHTPPPQPNGAGNGRLAQKPTSGPPPTVDSSKQVPAGIHGNTANNYFRAEGQNSGNFITVFGTSLSLSLIIQSKHMLIIHTELLVTFITF
ncbi:hypothetical protein AMTRI_Chr10g226320 [Amborella trichopoda]